MDANTLLFWSSVVLCTTVGIRTALLRSRLALSWIVEVVVLVAVMFAAFYVWPSVAGYIAIVLCVVLVLAPLQANVWTLRLGARRRYDAARRVARLGAALHPSTHFRELPGYVDALEKIYRGELDPSVLRNKNPATPLARFVYAQALRTSGQWRELLSFTEALPFSRRATEGSIGFLHLRALGELGELETLLTDYEKLEAFPAIASSRDVLRLLVAARFGRVDLVLRLLSGRAARSLPPSAAAYWYATSLQVAGRPEALTRLSELAHGSDPESARAALRRLSEPLPPFDPAALSARGRQILQTMEREINSAAGLAVAEERSPSTWLLLASIVAVFLLEVPDGSTNLENLVALGALVIPPFGDYGGFWRVFSAAWLHLGATHLVANALGLWVIGRRVEALFGSARMLVLFVGSAALANAVARVILTGPMVIVGASGGILGLLGALLAVTLRRHGARPTRYLRGALWEMLIVILAQFIFDWMTPAVSRTVHVAGLLSGIALGFVVPPRPPVSS